MLMRAVSREAFVQRQVQRVAFLIVRYASAYEKDLEVSARQLSLAAGLRGPSLCAILIRLQSDSAYRGPRLAEWTAIGEAAGADGEWWFCDTDCESPVDDSPARRRHIQQLALEADQSADRRERAGKLYLCKPVPTSPTKTPTIPPPPPYTHTDTRTRASSPPG